MDPRETGVPGANDGDSASAVPGVEKLPTPSFLVGSESTFVDATVSGEAAPSRGGPTEGAEPPVDTGSYDALLVTPGGVAAGTTVLPAPVLTDLEPRPVETTTTFDVREAKRRRRTERRIMALSTVMGVLGLAVALGAAGLDQLRYDQPTPCAAYAAAHKGHVGFGCTVSAKHLAVLFPLVGLPLLVLVGLAVAWIPRRSPAARTAVLGGFVALIVIAALVVAGAYSALPQNN